MKRILVLALAWLLVVAPIAHAQVDYPGSGGGGGGGSGSAGTSAPPFTPSGNFASLAVSTTSANVAVPTGSPSAIQVTNTGTGTAFINLGTSNAVTATTSNQPLQPGAVGTFVLGSNTFLAAITSTGTATLSIAGGALPAGAVSAASGGFVDGSIVTIGTEADTVWSSGNGTVIAILKNIATKLAGTVTTVLNQGGSVLSATNGLFSNILQGNAVLSTTNPLFSSITDGTNKQAVKAASTSPTLTDPAAVVSLSPNPAPVCSGVISISQTASTDLHTFTNLGYICSIILVSATAQNIGVAEGTGSVCATSSTPLIGSTGASSPTSSMVVGVNGGFSAIAASPWLKMQVSGDHLCLLQSSTGNVSGVITYQDHS